MLKNLLPIIYLFVPALLHAAPSGTYYKTKCYYLDEPLSPSPDLGKKFDCFVHAYADSRKTSAAIWAARYGQRPLYAYVHHEDKVNPNKAAGIYFFKGMASPSAYSADSFCVSMSESRKLCYVWKDARSMTDPIPVYPVQP